MMAFFITVKKKKEDRFLFVILSFILCDQSGDIELKPFNMGRLSCRTSIPYMHSELKLKSTTGKGACYISQSSDTLVLQVSLSLQCR